MELPQHFCWTKYGTEAGEGIESILRRKEHERAANGGIFLWGIGNSIRPSVEALLEVEPFPQVLFSPMRSRPAMKDASPAMVGRWTSATALDGSAWELPAHTVVTSGAGPDQGIPSRHYALVCQRTGPIGVEDLWWLDEDELSNLRSGSRLGSSQVTAVVRRALTKSQRDRYPVTMSATLASPYMVTLTGWDSVDLRSVVDLRPAGQAGSSLVI